MFDEVEQAIADMRAVGASDDTILDWLALVEAAGKPVPGQAPQDKLRVVVFEDDERMGRQFVQVLQDLGHDVRWFIGELSPSDQPIGESLLAATAESTLERPITQGLNSKSVDIVLLDYVLWGHRSGGELMRYFRKQGVPVVAISGSPSCNQTLLELGACRAVTKHNVAAELRGDLKLQALARTE